MSHCWEYISLESVNFSWVRCWYPSEFFVVGNITVLEYHTATNIFLENNFYEHITTLESTADLQFHISKYWIVSEDRFLRKIFHICKISQFYYMTLYDITLQTWNDLYMSPISHSWKRILPNHVFIVSNSVACHCTCPVSKLTINLHPEYQSWQKVISGKTRIIQKKSVKHSDQCDIYHENTILRCSLSTW